MQRIWLFFFIFVTGIFCQAHEAEEGRVYGTLGPYTYQTQPIYSHDSLNNPLLYGLGFLAEADIDDKGGLEVGLFYIDKFYQRVFAETHIVESVRKFAVPIGYRRWFLDRVGLALSLTTLFSVGPSSVIYTDIVSATNSTSARAEAEYGLESSLQVEFLRFDKFSFLIDARYFFSLSSQPAEDANQYGLMIGTKYLFHEK